MDRLRRSLRFGAWVIGVACASGSKAKRWYLTDVMAGFRIWTGSDATGLERIRFECPVK